MKLIKSNNLFYILSDEEIKEVGYRMDIRRVSVGVIDDDNYYNRYPNDFKKIIASNDKALGIPIISENDIRIVTGEFSLNNVADRHSDKYYTKENVQWHANYNGFISGYNQALINNSDRKFTLRDMEECWLKGADFIISNMPRDKTISSKQSFIDFSNSIKEKTEWDIEIEMDLDIQAPKYYPHKYCSINEVPKITNGFVKIILK